jgi:hypothetical protein
MVYFDNNLMGGEILEAKLIEHILEERWQGYCIAEKRTAHGIWILAPGANLEDLMKYINGESKTITSKGKTVASTSSDLQHTGKRERNLQSAFHGTTGCAVHSRGRDVVAVSGVCFDLVLPSLFVKVGTKRVTALLQSIFPPTHPTHHCQRHCPNIPVILLLS